MLHLGFIRSKNKMAKRIGIKKNLEIQWQNINYHQFLKILVL
jgi:hypothetical protein